MQLQSIIFITGVDPTGSAICIIYLILCVTVILPSTYDNNMYFLHASIDLLQTVVKLMY